MNSPGQLSTGPVREGPGPVERGPRARRVRARPTWQRPGLLGSIAIGGVIGACGRYEVALLLPTHDGAFPLATFVINITGSFALGIILTVLLERWRPNEYLRPFVATGIIGAYTTWSTFMTDTDKLIDDGHFALALAYVAASLAGGLLAAYAGSVLGRSNFSRPWSRGKD